MRYQPIVILVNDDTIDKIVKWEVATRVKNPGVVREAKELCDKNGWELSMLVRGLMFENMLDEMEIDDVGEFPTSDASGDSGVPASGS